MKPQEINMTWKLNWIPGALSVRQLSKGSCVILPAAPRSS